MKKIISLSFFILMTAQLATALNPIKSLLSDKGFVGVNTGLNVPSATFKFSGETNFQTGGRIGYNFTPCFGVMGEAQLFYGGNGPHFSVGKAINAVNLNLLGAVNVTNLVSNWGGAPRNFETIALVGIGPAHRYASGGHKNVNDCLVTKMAVDLAYNLGKDKRWQLYAEPALLYMVYDDHRKFEFNINNTLFCFNIGLNYRFGTSSKEKNKEKPVVMPVWDVKE